MLIEHLKKDDMAREAERLHEGTGWLPNLLRLPVAKSGGEEVAELPDFLAEDDVPESWPEDVEADDAYSIAAE